MAESSTKVGQGYNKAFADLYVAAGNAGAKVRDESRQTVTSVTDDLGKLNSGFNAITGLASKMFLGVSAFNIGMQVYQTRSYFQDAESSMKVFLGDAEKGSKFISELKDYAFYNMYEFKDLVGASKQLIAYGADAKDVIGILDKLSNIATGTGASLNDMVAMYNKAKSVGKIDSQGLASWASRGVLVQKTLKDMGEQVTGTSVTFEQLDKALDKVTGEGGMFHNLMKEQLNNLSASYAQLQDNLTSMYEEIGEKAEPFMKGAIDLAGLLVENYEGVADAILEVAKVYGAFKLVDMADIPTLLSEFNMMQQQAETESVLVETYKEHSDELQKLLTAEQAHALEMSGLEKGSKEYAVAIQEMITSEKERTENALKSVSTELDAETARKEKLDKLKSATEDQIATYQKSGDAKRVEALQTRLESVTEEQNASAKKINELQTKKTLAAIDAETAARNREKLATMQSTAAIEKHSRAMIAMQKVSGALNSGLNKLGKMLDGMGLTNPYALALAGAIALIDAIKAICTAETEWEQLSKKVDAAKAEAYKSTMSELRSLGINDDFQKVEELVKYGFGSQEYKDALNDLIEKYPVLSDLIKDATNDAGSEAGMLDILKKGYDAVTESIYAKNKASEEEKLIEENKKALEEQQADMLKEFKDAMENMDYDENAIEAIGEQYRVALMRGMNIEEMPKEVQKVFQDYKGGTGERILGFFGADALLNKSNEKGYWASWQQDALNIVGAADEGYKRYNTTLEAHQRQLERQTANTNKVNGELKEEVKNLNDVADAVNRQKDEDDYTFSPLLKELQEKQKAAKEALESLTAETLSFEEMTKDEVVAAKAAIKSYRDDYEHYTNQIATMQKRLYGDPNAAKQAYNQQLAAYKSFAEQYAAIEVKRQNEIDKLNQQRGGKDANNAIIDMQISDANQKAADDVTLLMAKYYKVSKETAAEIKDVFGNALTMPIDDAKDRLAEITTRLAKIADAASKGNNIATKEEQARLAAEKAGLEQNIAKSRERQDFSDEEKKYEEFYNELIRIANEKEAKLADLRQKQGLGIIDEKQLRKATENIEDAFTSQANIIRAKMGISGEETTEMILDKLGSATNSKVNELMTTLALLEKTIEELSGNLADGIDVTDALEEVRKEYQKTIDDLNFITSGGIANLEKEIIKANNELKALEADSASGKNVAVQIAQKKVQITQLETALKNYNVVQEDTAEKTGELTAEQQKLEQALADKAAYDKAAKNYGAVKNAISAVMDGCDGLDEKTRDIINGMMELGDILMDTVGGLLDYAVQSAQAMATAGVASAEAVKTAEKGSAILAVIGAAIQAVMAIVKIFNKHGKTAKAEKNIKNLDTQIKDLDRAYDKLGKSIEDAYAADATPLIEQQDTLLAQKQALLRQQIAEEKSKKKKKQDADQIAEWEREIEEIQDTRNNKQQTITEKLLGKDYKGVLEDFSSSVMSAMDDAETSVEDAVKNISKSIKKSAVQQQLNAKLQPITEEFAKTLGNAMTDGVLTETESQVLSGLEHSIAEISENYLGQFEDLWAQTEEASRKSVTGGIASVSQDTAEEMNGRLTNIMAHTYSINETVKTLADFSSRNLMVLQEIHVDTESLVVVTRSMKATLDDMSIKGVRLKA